MTIYVIDTSVLCIWLGIPNRDKCVADGENWDSIAVRNRLESIEKSGENIVVPIASIIETGNHVAHIGGGRIYEYARKFGDLLSFIAQSDNPWMFFSQEELWEPKALEDIARSWPEYAKSKMSLGDYSIKSVVEFLKRAFPTRKVEILTCDSALKAFQDVPISSQYPTPRRRNGIVLK